MSLKTLNKQIQIRAKELRTAFIANYSINCHKRREWKICDCSWCKTKRQGTVYIALAGRGLPKQIREEIRNKARKSLRRKLESL